MKMWGSGQLPSGPRDTQGTSRCVWMVLSMGKSCSWNVCCRHSISYSFDLDRLWIRDSWWGFGDIAIYIILQQECGSQESVLSPFSKPWCLLWHACSHCIVQSHVWRLLINMDIVSKGEKECPKSFLIFSSVEVKPWFYCLRSKKGARV